MTKKRKRTRGNGEGSIVRLNGNRKRPYAVRVTTGWSADGKQKFKYLSYHSRIADARSALRSYLVNPYDLENKDITLYEVYEKMMATNPVAESTMNNYRSAFRKCASIQDKPIRKIKAGHIEEIMEQHPPTSQRIVKSMLNKVYRYALKFELVDKNVVELVETEAFESKARQPFTDEQIRQIMAYDGHPLAHTIKIMLYTGFRISELLDIQTENVFLEEGYMVGGCKTEAGRNRIVPIHDEIRPLVASLYDPANSHLIVDHRGKPVSYRYFLMDFWTKIKEDIGFDHTPHCTRHTFVTHILRCGADRDVVQKIVGHKGDITDRYNHIKLEQLKLELGKLQYN